MAYIDVPPTKPNGKTIMLLHGKNFPAAYWDSTAGALRQKAKMVTVSSYPTVNWSLSLM